MGREFTKWLDFKYERLPDFYFYYGKLDHTKKYCHAYLQKCDESLVPPPCPYDLLLHGKEKSFEKPMPFQYPYAPAIITADLDLSDFPNGGQVMNRFLTHSIGFAPLLNSNVASISCLSAPRYSQSVMIPTLINPNHTVNQSSCLTSISTDSIIVSDSPALNNSELVHAAQSLAEALPSLDLGHTTDDNQTPRVEAPRPDPKLRARG
uniref:Zinc knuckle CX2CX4HX4C domain-containing protein n=1 Tax=Cannabis sativa TaxID=3483 RepID=A0A803QPZ5_CANSA